MNRILLRILIPLLIPVRALAFSIDAVGQSKHDNLFDPRSCHQLYIQATALEQQHYRLRHNYYTDKNAQAAGIASAVFTPALYYFGYAAYKELQSEKDVATTRLEIDSIRTRMAEKRCFDR